MQLETTNQLLFNILTVLENMAEPAVSEGFFSYSRKVFCNITKGEGKGWYTLEEGNAITQPPIFRGKVVSISFPTVERNGKDVQKFQLVMRADNKRVVFEAGYSCFFSKTILASLAITSPEVLAKSIQLATYIKELNTGDKTLAVSLRDSKGRQLPSEWQNNDDWKEIATVAINNVNAANSR